jgi:predicted Zn-dependent protease
MTRTWALLWLAAQAWAQPPLPEVDPAYRASPGFATYERANKQFVAGQFQQSLGEVEAALKLDPKLVPALTLKAKLGMAANRYDVARTALEQAMAASPSAWYAQFLYGFQFYQQNEIQQSLAPLGKARQLNPRDPRPALYLGLARESLGGTEEALRLYREAIDLEAATGKPHADTLLIAARLLLLTGQLEECGRLIARALQLAPQSREAHYERARLLLHRGAAADAAREGEAALRLPSAGTTDRQVRYLLVRAYQAAGDENAAARHASALRAIEDKEAK